MDLPEFLAGALVFASLLAHFYNIFVFFQKFSSGRKLGELFGAFSIFQLVLFFYVVYKLKGFSDASDIRIAYIDTPALWILAVHFLINFVYICFYAKEILSDGNDLKKPSDSAFELQNSKQADSDYWQKPAREFPQTDKNGRTYEYSATKPTYDFSSEKPTSSASPAGSTSSRLKTSIPSSKLSKIRISTDSAATAYDAKSYTSERTAGFDSSVFASEEKYLSVINAQIAKISEYFGDMEHSKRMNEKLLKSAGSGSRKSLDRLFAESRGLWICNYCDTMNDSDHSVCIVCKKSR